MNIPELPDYLIDGGKFVFLGVSYFIAKKEFREYLENDLKYKPYRKYIDKIESIGISFDEKLWTEEEGINAETFFANRYFDKQYRDLINSITKDPDFQGEPQYMKSSNVINKFLKYVNNPTPFENNGDDPLILLRNWRKESLVIIRTFFIELSKLFGLLKKEQQFKDFEERETFLLWLENLEAYFTTEIKRNYPELLSE